MRSLILLFVYLIITSCTVAPKKSVLTTAPPQAKKLFALAEADYQKRNWRSAETRLTEVINKYRSTDTGDDALFLLAKIYSRQEMWKKAFNVYESIYTGRVYSSREFHARSSAAKILTYKVGRPKQALELIDESLKRRPKSHEKSALLEIRFEALMKSGSQLEAFETLVALSKSHPIKAKRESFKSKAKAFLDSRLSGPELKDFADDSPSSQLKTDAMYRYGVLMMEQGSFSEAKSYLSDVVSSDPKSYAATQALLLIQQMSSNDKVSTRTLGVILPLSGRYSAVGYQSLYGIQLALGIRGGVNKNNVRLAIVDSQGNPEVARRGIKRLVRENQAIAIVGGLLGKTAYAASIQAQEMGVPFLALSQKEGLTDIGPFIFRNALTMETQIDSVVKTAMTDLKIKRFAVLFPNDKYGVNLSNRFWKTVKKYGGTVTAAQSYLPGETDFKETIQKLVGTYYVEDRQKEYKKRLEEWYEKNGGPNTRKKPPVSLLPPIVDFQALFIPDGPKAIGQIAPMLAYNDINNIVLMGTNIWNTNEFLRRGQNFVSQALFTDSFYKDDARYLKSDFFKKYQSVFGRPPSSFSLQGYDSGLILKNVLDHGTTSRMDFARDVTQNSEVNGALDKLILNKKKEFVRPVVTLTVKEGAIIPFTVQ